VFSLLSKAAEMAEPGLGTKAIPLLTSVPFNQSLTNWVRSTLTNCAPAAAITPAASTVPRAGAVE
jgi:hypothetical protein